MNFDEISRAVRLTIGGVEYPPEWYSPELKRWRLNMIDRLALYDVAPVLVFGADIVLSQYKHSVAYYQELQNSTLTVYWAQKSRDIIAGNLRWR